MKRKLLMILGIMLASTNVQAQEIGNIDVQQISISDIDIYGENKKIEFKGWITLENLSENSKSTYKDNRAKTDIEVKDTIFIVHDLNLKGECLQNGEIVIRMNREELTLDDNADKNILEIKEVIDNYNRDAKIKISYGNIETNISLLGILDEYKLFYTKGDKILISRELSNEDLEISNDEDTYLNILGSFLEDNKKNDLYRIYNLPISIIIE